MLGLPKKEINVDATAFVSVTLFIQFFIQMAQTVEVAQGVFLFGRKRSKTIGKGVTKQDCMQKAFDQLFLYERF